VAAENARNDSGSSDWGVTPFPRIGMEVQALVPHESTSGILDVSSSPAGVSQLFVLGFFLVRKFQTEEAVDTVAVSLEVFWM